MRSKRCLGVCVVVALAFAGNVHAQSGLQRTPTGTTLINKAVGDEQWAIQLSHDGTVTGNVFFPDGRDPAFVWCEPTDAADGDSEVSFDCFGSDPCLASPCVVEGWSFLATVVLPQSFFEPPDVPGPAAGEWGTRPDLLEANSEMAVAELDGLIYVIGGYPSTRVTTGSVQVYDPATREWELTTPVPQPVNHLMAAGVEGRVYVIGGQTTDAGGGNFTDLVWAYDPETAEWTSRAAMPTARGGGVPAVVGHLIYVAGGRPPAGSDFAVYDTRADEWTVLPDLPTQRNHLAAGAIDGKVYVAGGRFGSGFTSEQTDAIEVFDPETNSWSAGAPLIDARGGVNGIVVNDCFHLFGGEGNFDVAGGLWPHHDVYDPRTDEWTRLAPMPIAVHGVTGLAFLDGLLYLPGGGTQLGGSSGSTIHQVYRPIDDCRE